MPKTMTPHAGMTNWRSSSAEFDLALTVAALRYISDLHFGRASPGLNVSQEVFDLVSSGAIN